MMRLMLDSISLSVRISCDFIWSQLIGFLWLSAEIRDGNGKNGWRQLNWYWWEKTVLSASLLVGKIDSKDDTWQELSKSWFRTSTMVALKCHKTRDGYLSEIHKRSVKGQLLDSFSWFPTANFEPSWSVQVDPLRHPIRWL